MEDTLIERLEVAGFKVTPLNEDKFRLESNATGAVLMPVASFRDLKQILTGANYCRPKAGVIVDALSVHG